MIMLQWVNGGKICNYDAKFKVLDNGLVVLRERRKKNYMECTFLTYKVK